MKLRSGGQPYFFSQPLCGDAVHLAAKSLLAIRRAFRRLGNLVAG
jgi:hypothetical protein